MFCMSIETFVRFLRSDMGESQNSVSYSFAICCDRLKDNLNKRQYSRFRTSRAVEMPESNDGGMR